MPVYALDQRRPTIASKGWIAPDAVLIGDVQLGEDVGIWFGAVLRGDNEPIVVGARSNIQEHSVLHTDLGFPLIIGEDCTIGHRAILHGCRLGDRVLIGMGATVLNGAEIGDNCLVGANALVTEGKRFEPGSLIVGAPAKAVRLLSEEEQGRLKLSAAGYVRNWQRYAAGLSELG